MAHALQPLFVQVLCVVLAGAMALLKDGCEHVEAAVMRRVVQVGAGEGAAQRTGGRLVSLDGSWMALASPDKLAGTCHALQMRYADRGRCTAD